MSSKKREIYARAAVQLRSHERPGHAESICPGAMSLYLFLLVQARGEGSNGDVSEVTAYSAWSAPTAYRKKQAEALIVAGLVERRDGRLRVIRYEEHNDTTADIAAARAAAKEKKRYQRRPESVPRDNRGDTQGTTSVVPISTSYSLSGSDLSSERDPDPLGSPPEPEPSPADFDFGSAPYHKARDVFSDAVSAATGSSFVLDYAPFTGKDLCAAMSHRPKGSTLTQALEWLAPVVGEWVTSGEARPLTPRRFNDWLNERNAPRRPVSQIRSRNADRQPHDEGWLKRMREREAAAGTGTDDIFGGDL